MRTCCRARCPHALHGDDAADVAKIIHDLCLRSVTGIPDLLVVDHDPKVTSNFVRALVKVMGSCPIVGSAYHRNTDAQVERANGVIGDTLRAYACGGCISRNSLSTMRIECLGTA
jgi:hypothetical protein